MTVDFLFGRDRVFKQLFKQIVIKVRERFQHFLTRRRFIVGHAGRDLDEFGRVSGLVFVSPLAGKIDITGHRLVIHNRDVTEHQRAVRGCLESFQHFRHACAGEMVNLVEKQAVGNRVIVEKPENRSGHHGLVDRGLADHDGNIRDHQRVARILLKLDRSRTVKNCPMVTEKFKIRNIDFGAHLTAAGFRRSVADSVAGRHHALALYLFGCRQNGFGQARFAALVWADQGHASRVGRHCHFVKNSLTNNSCGQRRQTRLPRVRAHPGPAFPVGTVTRPKAGCKHFSEVLPGPNQDRPPDPDFAEPQRGPQGGRRRRAQIPVWIPGAAERKKGYRPAHGGKHLMPRRSVGPAE